MRLCMGNTTRFATAKYAPYNSKAPCKIEMVGMEIAIPKDQLFNAALKAAWFMVALVCQFVKVL